MSALTRIVCPCGCGCSALAPPVAERRLLDGPALAVALEVELHNVWNWARRGQLVAHGADPADRRRRLYDLDEALALVERLAVSTRGRPRSRRGH